MDDSLRERDAEARREWGEKLGREGEPVTNPNVSDDFKQGYRRGALGFGSNTTPRNFGRTGEAPPDWTCICGHENSGSVRIVKAKRVICAMCGIEKDLAMEAHRRAPDTE